MDYYKIGQRIRNFRKIHGISQEKLAELVGISVTHMSHIETGNTKLSLQVFVDIAQALNVSTDDLLPETSSVPKDQYHELLSILQTCDTYQVSIMTDMIKYMKFSLDKHQPSVFYDIPQQDKHETR